MTRSEEEELTREERARIASKAQAEAHRELREQHGDEYRLAYQRAKEQLTAESARPDRRRRGA